MKRTWVLLMMVVLLVSTMTATMTISAEAAFYTQKITGSGVENALNLVQKNEGSVAYNKAYYLMYSSQYAAAYQKTFPYTNSTYPHSAVVDNGATYTITNSGGCMTYSNYVCKYVFNAIANSASRKYATGTAGSLTANSIKELITTHAQFGEHIRIDGIHSISFIAYDANGFYYTSYNTDSNPIIYLAYTTWSNFAKECNSKGKAVWIYNTITTTNVSDNTNTTVTVYNYNSDHSNTITNTNAILHNLITKPSGYPVTKLGIRVKRAGDTYENGWSLFHAPSQSYVGETKIHSWFNMNGELNLTLIHCTGYYYQFYCEVNGSAYWSDEAYFSTTGTHTFGPWEITEPATCIREGKKQRTCTECLQSEIITINATNVHSYGEWQTVIAPTCTTEGSKQRYCSCGAIETTTVAALGHDYSPSWTIDVAATCTSAGSKSRHCTRCSAVTDVTAIDQLAHSYGQWFTTKAVTCTIEGIKQRNCFCGAFETAVVSALGHDFSQAWTVDVEPSCTVAGVKSHHCTRCTVVADRTDIAATGHKWQEWQIEKEPTITESGTEVRKCTDCLAVESKTIPPLGADGHTHVYGEWEIVKEATCATKGFSERKCELCEAKEIVEIAATEHIFGEWTLISEATYTTEGKMQRVCESCNEKDTLVIPVLKETASVIETPDEPETSDSSSLDTDVAKPLNVNHKTIVWIVLGVTLIGAVLVIITVIVLKKKR